MVSSLAFCSTDYFCRRVLRLSAGKERGRTESKNSSRDRPNYFFSGIDLLLVIALVVTDFNFIPERTEQI